MFFVYRNPKGGLGVRNIELWNVALMSMHVRNILIARIPYGSVGYIRIVSKVGVFEDDGT